MDTPLPLNTYWCSHSSFGARDLAVGSWRSHALKAGYRHIDCAYAYANEDEVGESLKEVFESGLSREELLFGVHTILASKRILTKASEVLAWIMLI